MRNSNGREPSPDDNGGGSLSYFLSPSIHCIKFVITIYKEGKPQ
jgi:hypothetical protein